jgi:hypothetical protein
MASMNDQSSTMEDLLKQMNKRLITLERRRNGDGIAIDGACFNGGGSGGDTSYYGGGTDYPDGTYPPGSWVPGDVGGGGGGGTYTAGPNIDIDSNVIRVSVPFVEPTGSAAPPGIFWFDETG